MPAHARTVRRRPPPAAEKFRTSVRTGTDDTERHRSQGRNRSCLPADTGKAIAMPPSTPHLDNDKLEQFFGRFVQDL